MRLLLDTDVLLDLALGREPFADAASALFDVLEARPGLGWIAWHSASNLYYLVHSAGDGSGARSFLRDLLRFIEVAPTGTESLLTSLRLEMKDFEDAMQVAAAVACGAGAVVTRNVKDYQASPVPALTPRRALEDLA